MILQLLALQIATFVILLLVLRKLFYKQLSSALIRLQSLQEQNIIRERELKKKIEDLDLERIQVLDKAKQEGERIILEATISAAKVTSDMEEQTEFKALEILKHGQSELERKEKELLAQTHLYTIDQAVKLIQSVFSPGQMDAVQVYFIDELVHEVEAMDKGSFSALTKDVKVTTAYPLSDAKRQDLVRILKEKIGPDSKIDFVQSSHIIAGLVISIGALTIDGSLKNKLNKTAVYLKNHDQ